MERESSPEPIIIKIKFTRHEEGLLQEPVGAHLSAEFQAQVESPYGSGLCLSNPGLLQCTTEEIHKEIEWYYEKYPLSDVFNRPRANAAELSLHKHGYSLLASFLTETVLPKDKRRGSVLLQINSAISSDDTVAARNFSRCLWEYLEDPTIWLEVLEFLPDRVTVVRTHGSEETGSELRADLAQNYAKILVTTARLSNTQDIPHRLISRAIHGVVQQVSESRGNDDFQLVRPGTFEALKETLMRYEYGYFNILHLDMHGFIDVDGQACLSFATINSNLDIEANAVGVEKLASLLQNRGVRIIILNACQSSTNKGASSNFAEQLIDAGMDIVIGMQYDMMSRSAEFFVRNLYEALLLQGKSIFESVTLARAQLRLQPLRRTRFGHNVSLKDYVVPAIHCSDTVFESFQKQLRTRKMKLTDSSLDISDIQSSTPAILGREYDMLFLETIMIQLPKLSFNITGPIGIGKTAFLQDIGRWWVDTAFMIHQHAFNIAQLCDSEAETVGVGDLLNKKIEQIRTTCTIHRSSQRCEHRLLVVIDDLDDVQWDSSPASIRNQKQLRTIVRRLENTFWIFTSKRPMEWLSSVAIFRELRALDLAESLNVASQSEAFSKESSRIFLATAAGEYFEELILSCCGNPLAVKIMIGHIIHQFQSTTDCSMASIFESFLELKKFHIDKAVVLQWTNSHSVRRLWAFLDYLKAKSSFRNLARVKRRINPQRTRSFSDGANTSDKMLLSDGNSLILSLGIFCSVMPDNLSPFLALMSLQPLLKVYNSLPRIKEVLAALFDATDYYTGSTTDFEKLISDSLESCNMTFLAYELRRQVWQSTSWAQDVLENELAPWFDGPKESLHHEEQKSYRYRYRVINPVLTQILRAAMSLDSNVYGLREEIQVALAFSFRCRFAVLENTFTSLPAVARVNRTLLDYDFLNCLSYAHSTQVIDSWPTYIDWTVYNTLNLSLGGEPRREKLLAVFDAEFANTMVTPIEQARIELISDADEDGIAQSQIDHSIRWMNITRLEMICVNCLLFSLSSHEKYFLPLSGLKNVFDILNSGALLYRLRDEEDGDLKSIFTLRLKVCEGLLMGIDGSGDTRPIDFMKTFENEVEALKLAGFDIQGLVGDRYGNDVTSFSPVEKLKHMLDLATASGFREQPFESALLAIRPQTADWTEQECLSAISKLEAMLEEEVHKSNDPLRKVALFGHLAGFNTMVSNYPVAADHQRRTGEILLALGQDGALVRHRQEQREQDFIRSASANESGSEGLSSDEKASCQLKEYFEDLANLRCKESRDYEAEIDIKNKIAIHLRNMHRAVEAIDYYKEVVEYRKEMYGSDDFRVLDSECGLARSYCDLGQYEESIGIFEGLRTSIVRLHNPTEMDEKWSNLFRFVHCQLGGVQLALAKRIRSINKGGLLVDAERNFKTAEQYIRKQEGTSESINALAEVLTNQAFIQDANKNYLKAVELQTESLSLAASLTTDPSNDSLLIQQYILAYLLGQAGQDKLAEQKFRSVIRKRIEKHGSNHHDSIDSIQAFGLFLERRGRHTDAQALATQYLVPLLSVGKLKTIMGKKSFTFEAAPLGTLGQEHIFDDSISPTDKNIAIWSSMIKQQEVEVESYKHVHGQISTFTLTSALRLISLRWLSGDRQRALDEQSKLYDLLDSSNSHVATVRMKFWRWTYTTLFCLIQDAEAQAQEICKKARDLGMPELPDYQNQIADILEKYEQLNKALPFRRENYELNINKHGADNAETLNSLIRYAWTTSEIGKESEVLELLINVHSAQSKALQSLPDIHANIHRMIGMSLMRTQRHSEALGEYEEACRLWRSSGAMTSQRASTLKALSESYSVLNLKDSRYLETLVKEEVEVAQVVFGEDHAMTLEALARLSPLT